MELIFSYNRKSHAIIVDKNTLLSQMFEMIKGPLGLDRPMENYFIIGQNQVFGAEKLNLMTNPANLPDSPSLSLSIVTNEEKQIMDTFAQKCLASLTIDVAMMPVNETVILSKINLLRHLAKCSYDENDLLALMELIPSDKFTSVTGIQLFEAVLKWFNEEFMQYMQKPVCHCCQSEVERIISGNVSFEEAEEGAITTWRYRCSNCGACTRYPRYSKVSTLVETRVGQSMEYSVLFAAILNSFGVPTRIVCNMNYDRFWVEAFNADQQIYVHIDPVEGIVDAPLIYEQWGRTINWVIAASQYGITDVTPRYTKDVDKIFANREKLINEDEFQKLIQLADSISKNGVESDLVQEDSNRQLNDVLSSEREPTEVEKQPQKVGNE